eukprot:TRINITY_DN898_c1_g2_i1.p1 TRINITY_DN898_c1_g2~~TRINITY_DN898_c1_g2_i1.p1  ORF type:complete len:342 (+),score=70.35 TRINITY_DN898_c1_g2_i1:60-1028(+)
MCTREGRSPLGEMNGNVLSNMNKGQKNVLGMNNSTNSNNGRPPMLYYTPPPKKFGVRVGTPASSPGSSSSGSLMEDTPAPVTPFIETPVKPHKVALGWEDRYLLPPQDPAHHNKVTVVFDLDETLVSNRKPGVSAAIARNYLIHMFQLLKGLVEVVLWTASTEDTGKPVVRQIDPKGEFFHHVLYRSPKWFTDGSHTKDLTLLGRDMDKVVIVENTPNCCKFNPQNALIVEDFIGDLQATDRTLLCVATVIRGLVESVKKGGTVTSYLSEHCASAHSVIDVYRLGLSLAYSHLSEEEAMSRVQAMAPLMRPPLGLYYYVKKN